MLFRSVIMGIGAMLIAGYVSAALADHSVRMSPNQLQTALDKRTYLILDVRSPERYNDGHIEGAINFPVDWTYQQKSQDGSVVQPEQAQRLFRDVGIRTHQAVVVYDDGGLMDAARVFWMLEAYSVANVSVLEGGFEGWQHHNFPISLTEHRGTPSDYVAKIDPKRIASKFTTLLATKNPQQVIIDARSIEEYEGKKSTAKRFGHIPSALSIPATKNVSALSTGGFELLSEASLAQIYHDVQKDQRVILYCTVGRVSSANYLALRMLGYEAANYDASWKEWSNDLSLPVENPAEKSVQ